MEASKLYNLVWDIILEENSGEVNQKLQSIIDSVSLLIANRNNLQAQTKLDETKKELLQNLRNSELNNVSPSNRKILNNIGASKYIGNEFADSVESLLEVNSFNVSTIVKNLTKLKKERESIFSVYESLKDNFDTIGLEPHYWITDHYEVGLILPASVTKEHEIPEVCKYLKKWNQILKDINEIVGEDSGNIKISLIDNGSLEFFFDNVELTATIVITAIERLAALYKKILDIRKVRMDLQKYDFPKSEQNAIQKHETDTIEKEIRVIGNKIFSEYAKKKFEGGRRNELKNALDLHLKYIAKELDKGVIIEVTPPGIEEPKAKDGQTVKEKIKEKELYERKKARIDLIKSKIGALEAFNDLTKEAFKYLKEPKQ